MNARIVGLMPYLEKKFVYKPTKDRLKGKLSSLNSSWKFPP
jgi:hypothetical protein